MDNNNGRAGEFLQVAGAVGTAAGLGAFLTVGLIWMIPAEAARWWATVATVAALAGPALAWWGRSALAAAVDQGRADALGNVQQAALQTLTAAAKVAEIRVSGAARGGGQVGGFPGPMIGGPVTMPAIGAAADLGDGGQVGARFEIIDAGRRGAVVDL